MRVFCKRTFFVKNVNYYPINGKNYGEDYAVWKKGKYYNVRIPKDYEKDVGIYYNIESERESFWNPIKEKEFKKHFIDVDELRNDIIEKILK